MRLTIVRIVLGSLPLAASGCGANPLTFNPDVQGTVKVGGQPLRNVRIEFLPIVKDGVKGITSYAITDGEGRYKMVGENQKPGAVIAKHRALILQGRPDAVASRAGEDQGSPMNGEAPPADNKAVPPEYALAGKTPLQIDVTADKHTYNIDVPEAAK